MARLENTAGMAGFVGKRNESNDDLKVSTKPGKASANTHVTRAADGTTASVRNKPRKSHSAHQHDPRTLHDTNTSLGPTTTTTSSTHRAHSGDDAHRRDFDTVLSREPPDEPENPNPDEFELVTCSDSGLSDDEQELPEQPGKGVKARKSTAGHADAPQASQAKPDGRNLGRISGDTYPETTSGRPSTTHTDDHRPNQTAADAQTDSARSILMPERGAGTRLTYMPQNVQPPSHGLNRQQALTPQQQIVAQPPRPEDILKQVQSSFVYGTAGSNRPQAAHTQSANPHMSQHYSTNPGTTSTVHRAQPISGNKLPIKDTRNEQPSQDTRPEPKYTYFVPFQKPRPESGRRYDVPEPQIFRQAPQPLQRQLRHHDDNVPPAQMVDASESENTSEVGDLNNNYVPRKSSTGPQYAHPGNDEPVSLDYDPPGLYEKTFNDLKAASFDADPNATEAGVMAALQPDDPLPKKLQTLLTMDVRAKQEYFTSLCIEEWEEAGDWFIESFAKLTDRFKIARQEKRKMAREFENEVEVRHGSIFKKQKLTAGALNEMKESGGKVLQGTPKKVVR